MIVRAESETELIDALGYRRVVDAGARIVFYGWKVERRDAGCDVYPRGYDSFEFGVGGLFGGRFLKTA